MIIRNLRACASQSLAQGQVVHLGGEQQATATGATLADALRHDVGRVIRNVRAIALDEPGFEKQFPPPDSDSTEALIATARAFVELLADAARLKKFTDHAMPETVLDRLEVNADDLEAAGHEQDDAGSGHVTATQSAGRAVKAGMKGCLRLDVIVENVLGEDPDEMAQWQQARHTRREPVRKKRSAKNKPADPAPQA